MKQIPEVKKIEKANFTELEKPFGYLESKDGNFITCLDVKFKTDLNIEKVKEKIKTRDYLMILLMIDSIILMTKESKNDKANN